MGRSPPTSLLLVVALCVQCASVDDGPARPAPRSEDHPRARAIVDRMTATYASLDSYVDTGVAIVDRDFAPYPAPDSYVDAGVAIDEYGPASCAAFRTAFVRPDRFCFEQVSLDTWRAGIPVIVWKEGREIREWLGWDDTWPLRTKSRYLTRALPYEFEARRVPGLLLPWVVGMKGTTELTRLELVGSDRVDGFDCFLIRATAAPAHEYARRTLPEERWEEWRLVFAARPEEPPTVTHLWIDKSTWLLRKTAVRFGHDCSQTVTYYRPEADGSVDDELLAFQPRFAP